MEIYGVNTMGPVTPIMVRDAILRCFTEAHRDGFLKTVDTSDLSKEEMDSAAKLHIELLVKNAFSKTKGNYERPDKESLIRATEYLADYAKNFRTQDVVQAHVDKIMRLIDCLDQ
ncbi:hypothetical protein KKC94_04000 [Patescibacteria group bacterium]|nr:hypothetical protein [Patescibacteria group bacterium]